LFSARLTVSQGKYQANSTKQQIELLSEYLLTPVDSDENTSRRVATENKLAHPQPRTGICGYHISSLRDDDRKQERGRKEVQWR
jgi:hypothetical protein